MPDDFFAIVNDLPRHGDLEDWQRWHDQLVASGNDLIEMVDTLLASSTDVAMEQRLEFHRARIVSVLVFAQQTMSKKDVGRTTAPTSGKVLH